MNVYIRPAILIPAIIGGIFLLPLLKKVLSISG